MLAERLAIIPVGPGRTPFVSGFNRWSRPPGARTVAAWCDKYPDANIGVVPGLSGKVVFDVDSIDEVGEVEEMLGHTDLRTNTNRGIHLWYSRTLEHLPCSLRKFGLNVDIKAGNSIVIAPPSIHESGKSYALADGCDWSALKHLRQPNTDKLRNFIEKRSAPKPNLSRREMRLGSRKLWLNDLLCSHVMHCDTEDELLDVARTANMQLSRRGAPMLEDAIVVKRSAVVWKDAQDGNLETWRGRSGNARVRGSEIDVLCKLSPRSGPEALMLLMRLRIEHSAACRRGDTFCITPKAMANANVIHGWTRERYETARDLLLLSGFIEMVSGFKSTGHRRIGAQYKLTLHSAGGEAPISISGEWQ